MGVYDELHAQGFEYEVCVRCFTYNQSQYIEQTLIGFEKQVTAFPFVCVVVDDASTDGEQQLLEKHFFENYSKGDGCLIRDETDNYLLLSSRHIENPNCQIALYLLKKNHYSSDTLKARKMEYISRWMGSAKYIAICEGDDYWIDSNKLERQVGFLNNNADYVLTYTDAIIVDKDSKVVDNRIVKRYSGDCLRSLIENGNYIVTASVCYRNSADSDWFHVRSEIPFPLLLGDKPHWMYLATKGKFYYFPQKMIAYRVLANSASHTTEYVKAMTYSDNVRDINLYFNDTYNVHVNVLKIIGDSRIHRIRCTIPFGRSLFIKELFRSISADPCLLFRFDLWKIVLLSLKQRRY